MFSHKLVIGVPIEIQVRTEKDLNNCELVIKQIKGVYRINSNAIRKI